MSKERKHLGMFKCSYVVLQKEKSIRNVKRPRSPGSEGRLVLTFQCDFRLHTGIGLCSALHLFSALQENHHQLAVLDLQVLPDDAFSATGPSGQQPVPMILANPCTSFPELTFSPAFVSVCRTDSAILILDLEYY